MIMFDMQIGSEDWLAERRKRITASDTPKILGFSRWGTGLDVCLDKWNEAPPTAATPAMKRGLILEESVARAYSHRTGRKLEPGFFAVHSKHPWFAATPDRKIAGNGGLVQIKTHLTWLEDEYGPDGSNAFPEAELLQVLHELEVTGADYADLVPVFGTEAVFDMLVYLLESKTMTEVDVAQYIIDKMDLRIYRIERDNDLQKSIVEADREFREKYIIPHEIPPDAPTFENRDTIRKATEEEIEIIQTVKDRWIEQRKAEKGLDTIKDLAKKTIGEDKGIDAGYGEKLLFGKSKDTTEEVIDWKAIANEIGVTHLDMTKASEMVVNWENAVKGCQKLLTMPSSLYEQILAENTKSIVKRKGVRTFRVPHQKWGKEI